MKDELRQAIDTIPGFVWSALPDGSVDLQAQLAASPLVLLTRMRGTLDTWDPLFLDQLAATHRIITVDYPGIGYSGGSLPTDVAEVAAFVNAFTTDLA